MLKYIPGLAKIGYQGQFLGTETKRKYADESYKNKKVIEFNVQLTANHYTNFQFSFVVQQKESCNLQQ